MSHAAAQADENDPLARPGWACVLHHPPKSVGAWWPADDNFATCTQCDTALRERLDDVARRYLQLDTRPGASFESGARGTPGFASRPPLNLHVTCLRDPRSSVDAHVWVAGDGRVHAESERPPLSVHGVLSTQSWAVAEHRGVDGPSDRDDVFALIRFLGRHLSYAARHAELVVDLDVAVRGLLGQLRPVTGDGRKRIGRCPAELSPAELPQDDAATSGDDQGSESQRCGATLYAPLAGSGAAESDGSLAAIRCYACGAVWEYADWLALGDLLQAVGAVQAA